MTENFIQNEIRVALSAHGVVFRANSGEFWQGNLDYSKDAKKAVLVNLRRVQGLPKGFSDLLFFGFDGRCAFIEVKKPKQKQKPEQVKFMQYMQSIGYRAGVAYSVADALQIIGAAP